MAFITYMAGWMVLEGVMRALLRKCNAQPLLKRNPQENGFILKLKALLSFSSTLPVCICV